MERSIGLIISIFFLIYKALFYIKSWIGINKMTTEQHQRQNAATNSSCQPKLAQRLALTLLCLWVLDT